MRPYTIQDHDRLSDVARRHGVSVYAILIENQGLRRARTLGGAPCFHESVWTSGRTIKIPGTLGFGQFDPVPNSNGAFCFNRVWNPKAKVCQDSNNPLSNGPPECANGTWVQDLLTCSIVQLNPTGASCHAGSSYDKSQGLCVTASGGTSTPICDDAKATWDLASRTCAVGLPEGASCPLADSVWNEARAMCASTVYPNDPSQDTTPVCDEGFAWSGSACVFLIKNTVVGPPPPATCPMNTTWDDVEGLCSNPLYQGKGKPPTCPATQTWSPSNKACIGGTALPPAPATCPGMVYDAKQGACMDGAKGYAPTCPSGQAWSSFLKKCDVEPGQGKPGTAPPGASCPGKSSYDDATGLCVDVALKKKTPPVCLGTKVWSPTSRTCVWNAAGQGQGQGQGQRQQGGAPADTTTKKSSTGPIIGGVVIAAAAAGLVYAALHTK